MSNKIRHAAFEVAEVGLSLVKVSGMRGLVVAVQLGPHQVLLQREGAVELMDGLAKLLDEARKLEQERPS